MAGGYILKQVPLYPVKYVPPAGGGFFLPGPLGGRFFPRSLVVGGRFLNITIIMIIIMYVYRIFPNVNRG